MTSGRAMHASLAFGVLILIGAVVASAVLLTSARSDNQSTARTTSTLPLRERVEPAEFLDAWARSHVGPYAQAGSITRSRGEQVEITPFRRAASDGLELNQVGPTAIVIDGTQQLVCEVLGRDDIRCGGPEPAPTPDEQRRTIAAELAPEGGYLLYTGLEPGCYVLVFDGPVELGSRFGQESRLCFDPATGALVSQVERTGASEEVMETSRLTMTVEESDLEPVFLG